MRLKVLVRSSVPIFVCDERTESNELKYFSKLKADRLNRCGLVKSMAALVEEEVDDFRAALDLAQLFGVQIYWRRALGHG